MNMQIAIAWLRERRKLWTFVVLYAFGWLTMAGYFDLSAMGFDFDARLTMNDALSGIAGIIGAFLLERIPNQSLGERDNGGDTLNSPFLAVVVAFAAALMVSGCWASTGGGATDDGRVSDRNLRGEMATLAQATGDLSDMGVAAIMADRLTVEEMRSAVAATSGARVVLDNCRPVTDALERGDTPWALAVVCGVPALAYVGSLETLVTDETDGRELHPVSLLRAAAQLALLPSPGMVRLQDEIRAADDRHEPLPREIVDRAFADMRQATLRFEALATARLAAVGAVLALARL